MFDNTGYLFAYSAVQGKVHAIRLNHFGFEYRQVFHHFPVLPLLFLFLSGLLLYLPHCFVTLFFGFSLQAGKFVRKEIRHVGVVDRKFFCFTAKELTVQPRDLSRQLLDTFLQILDLSRLVLVDGRQ